MTQDGKSEFNDKLAESESELFEGQSGSYSFICGAHWQHVQSTKKITELETELKNKDAVRLWNENEQLKNKLARADALIKRNMGSSLESEDEQARIVRLLEK